jgi:tetratricopeptide (TPR) repeat protein
MSPGSPGSVDQFARSNVFVPPVLRDQGPNYDETEARTSINFVNWLQAQGALQQDGVPVPPRTPIPRQLPPSGSLPVSDALPLSSQMPPRGQPSPLPAEPGLYNSASLPEAASARSAEIAYAESQPDAPSDLISPQTDELRRMFAELGQQAGSRNGAEGGFFADSEADSMSRGRSEASEIFQPPQEAEPKDYPARLDRARARLESGQIEEALTDYRLVLKNAPDLLSDVMSDLNGSLEEAPDHPEVHRLLGDAYIRQGNYLQALESYNRAVALTQAQNG